MIVLYSVEYVLLPLLELYSICFYVYYTFLSTRFKSSNIYKCSTEVSPVVLLLIFHGPPYTVMYHYVPLFHQTSFYHILFILIMFMNIYCKFLFVKIKLHYYLILLLFFFVKFFFIIII